jgi:deoxycytidylate deaminase
MINCLKRTVVCVIMDANSKVIGVGRNQCAPPLKMDEAWRQRRECARIGIQSKQEGYDGSGCNSVHAEIYAIASMDTSGVRPFHALIMGHEFACDDCTKALKDAGVSTISCMVVK